MNYKICKVCGKAHIGGEVCTNCRVPFKFTDREDPNMTKEQKHQLREEFEKWNDDDGGTW